MGMKHKTYPKYKDSGVPWVGEVPVSWEMKRLRRIFSEKRITHNSDLPCGSISFGKVVKKSDEKIPVSTKASYQVLNKGEFLVNPLNLNYDLKSLRIGLSGLDVVVSSGYIILQSREGDKRFLNYMLHRYDVAHMKLLGSGVRQTISFNHISDSLLPLPSPNEQTAIATFLDEKVGKVDEAIAQKEQLIELLNERKQIVIQNAVTKGLNPNAPMKDSGIEWIGQIPEHWEVKRLKGFIDNLESGVSVNASEAEAAAISEVGVLKTSSVYGFRFNGLENKRVIKTDLSRVACPVKRGRIIISRMNAPDLVGASGLVTKEYPNLFLPDRLWQTVYNTRNEFCHEWLSICLASPMIKALLPTIAVGSSPSMKNISKGDFLNLSLPVPTVSEQQKIVEKINSETEKVGKAIVQTTQSITKLKEYKATLINSAVTGKINVSNYGH